MDAGDVTAALDSSGRRRRPADQSGRAQRTNGQGAASLARQDGGEDERFPLQVLQLNKRYWPHLGGIERHLRDLAGGLARRPGVAVSALVCNEAPRRRQERVDGVAVEAVPGYGTLWSLPVAPSYPLALRQRLSREVSVVHLHEPFPLGAAAWLLGKAGRRSSPPLVVTWHSDVVRQRLARPLYGTVIRRVLAQTAAVVVPAAQHIAVSRYLPPVASKCRVIPFGIEAERYGSLEAAEAGAALRRRLGAGRVVLFVGRLVYYKGLPHLIRAMQQVEATLVLAGEGRDRGALQVMARACGVADRVYFAGAVPDEELPAYYQACDVFALPSVAMSEGFGIVQLEAMASGKPVVSTALPTGVSAVNQHGVTGLVVPPADSGARAAALQALLDDPSRAAAYGRQGRERVTRQFSLDAMVDATLSLYRELAGGIQAGA